MSMAFFGSAAGIFIFSPLSEFLISTQGWRSAWLLLGCGGSSIVVLVAVLVIRKDPITMGLRPDGDPPVIQTNASLTPDDPSSRREYSWTRSQAIRSHTFWALVAIVGLRSLSVSTLQVFRIPYYIEQGISAHLVAWAISTEAVISALISIPIGRAMDRFQPRCVVAAALALFCIVFIVTMNVRETWHVFIATALYGTSAASYVLAQNAQISAIALIIA